MTRPPVRNPSPSLELQRRRGVWVALRSIVSVIQDRPGFLDSHHNFAVLCNLLNAIVNFGNFDRGGGASGLPPLAPRRARHRRVGRGGTRLAVRPGAAVDVTPIGFNMGVAWVGPSLMLYGTEEQKTEFIPRITSLEHIWCTLYSEPAAGSDLAAIQTKAVRDGDDYVINGQKIWTTGAHRSNWGWIAARTDPDAPKHKGLSMFLVPMDAPGITIRPLINMAGDHGFNEVFFEDVRIPARYLVGQENMGWYMLAVALDFERSSIAGSARLRRALGELLEFAKQNPQFIENKPEIRSRLADIYIEIEIAAALSYRVASLQAGGKAPNYEATIAKLYSTELTQRFASTGIELMGMYGPLHPKSKYAKMKGGMERSYQLAVSATIAGGTSEVMKTIGAIRGLGLPRA